MGWALFAAHVRLDRPSCSHACKPARRRRGRRVRSGLSAALVSAQPQRPERILAAGRAEPGDRPDGLTAEGGCGTQPAA